MGFITTVMTPSKTFIMKMIITAMTTMTLIMVTVHQNIQPPVMAFTTTITITIQIVGE